MKLSGAEMLEFFVVGFLSASPVIHLLNLIQFSISIYNTITVIHKG